MRSRRACLRTLHRNLEPLALVIQLRLLRPHRRRGRRRILVDERGGDGLLALRRPHARQHGLDRRVLVLLEQPPLDVGEGRDHALGTWLGLGLGLGVGL